MNAIGPEVSSAISALLAHQGLAFGVRTPVGRFVVVSFSAQEAVNAVPEIHLELASHEPDIDLHALMDSDVVLSLHDRRDGVSALQPRYLAGVVSEAERGDSGIRRTFYSLTLRGELHRLAHMADSRIWQDVTVVDIAQEVLSEHEITRVEWALQFPERYQKREFATQYREDNLSFLLRLLNEEGIFLYHKHAADGLTAVFTDAAEAAPMAAQPILPHNATSGGQTRAASVLQFSQRERLRSSSYHINDYSYHSPATQYAQKRGMQENNGLKGKYELYDPDGRYKDPQGVGAEFVRNRIEAVRVDATTGQGLSDAIHLSAGHAFELTDHPDAKANDRHYLLSVTHSGQQSAALEEDAGSAPTTYSASFATMPARLPYRPPTPPKPVVDGPQIVMITGPEGEEIHTDEDGRVKAWFLWDYRAREAAGGDISKIDDRSSCWIRVAQNWAGGSWGHIAIPRIGQECICEFLDGDPDQPIITGRTYHATNRPPYPLPANKTVMTIKSQTHKGEGYNELRFEDEKDREEVWMHAQKDHNTVINNDETHQIGHDRSKSVGNDQSESIGHDKTISVGNDHTESIGHDARHNVGNDVFYQVARNQQERCGKDHIHNVGNILKQDVFADHLEVIGRNYEGQVNGRMKLDVGATITTNAGQVHKLMAGAKFEIAGPGGKITIDGSGITLEAPKIDLKGAVSMGGSGSAQVPTLSLAANEGLPLCEECPAPERD